MTILPLLRASVPRRLVLGIALAAGLALAIAAGDDRTAPDRIPVQVINDASAVGFVLAQAPAATQEPAKPSAPAAPEAPASSGKAGSKVDATISIGEDGVVIRRNRPDGDVVVGDHEFDSFEQFVEQAPWLAALVFMVTALVFLVPLLVIVLIIWYKMRSNRLRNETMLKLAERGVVAPAAAMEAVAASPAASALETSPVTAPLYEQAKQVRKRAAWSDLRKGVIMGGIGLGLTFYSMLADGEANGLGLVLLFVGIGYGVLWYFEERQLAAPRNAPSDPRGGA